MWGTSARSSAHKQVLWVLDESKGISRADEGTDEADATRWRPRERRPLPAQDGRADDGRQDGGHEGRRREGAEPLAYKDGKTETINGFSCVSYDVSARRKRSRVWVRLEPRLTASAEAFRLRSLRGYGRPHRKHFSISFEQSFSETDNGKGLPGVPIRTIVYGQDGSSVVEMKKIAKEDIPAAKFELPAGLKKQEIGMKVQTQITEPD
jgi:hypothetical protein